MNLSPSKGFNIFYDLYLQQLIKYIKENESSINNGKQEEESITIDGSSWDRENKLFHVVSKDEGEVFEEGIITFNKRKKEDNFKRSPRRRGSKVYFSSF